MNRIQLEKPCRIQGINAIVSFRISAAKSLQNDNERENRSDDIEQRVCA